MKFCVLCTNFILIALKISKIFNMSCNYETALVPKTLHHNCTLFIQIIVFECISNVIN